MKVNFKIEQNYAISNEGRLIDLHNNFDFVGFEYRVEPMTLVLNWKQSTGDWVNDDEYSSLALIHKQVSFFSITGRDPVMYTSEDTCLSEITYFPSAEQAINDSFIYQDFPKEDDDILYIFRGGQSIRVNCSELDLIVG